MIAEFLDRETAKIDALVEEQQRLIELLKEKRQAVISHAVTKGLNPHAPMKPSGIEWLGDVPEHWTRSQPKHFTTKIVDGVHFKPNYLSEGIPFVTVQNLTAGRGISFDNLNYISEQDHEQFFRRANPEKGDVLLTKDGATLGIARVVETDEVFSIFVSVALLKPNPKQIDSWFLRYALESSVVFQQFKAGEQGSASKHIHLVDLRNVLVALPPITEQRQIVDQLNEAVGRLACLERVAERAIQLLQERRTALISAAVTGKIDVRRLAESEAA
jgi:type I restriction enzyme, S subunit